MEPPKAMMIAAHKIAQRYITDAKLTEIFEQSEKRVAEDVIDGVMMKFWLYGHNVVNDEWALMPVLLADWPPPEPMTKDEVMMGIGVEFDDKFPDFKLVAIAHESESWFVQRKPGEATNIVPSMQKDRVESALSHVMTLDHRIMFSCREIVRDDTGKVLKLKPLIEDKYDPEVPNGGMKDYLSAGILKGWFMASSRRM